MNLQKEIGELNPVIILTIRNPIKAFYKESYENWNKTNKKSINDFAQSNDCSIYKYNYLIEVLLKNNFTKIKLLEYDKLINGEYKASQIFDIDSNKNIVLEHQNKTIIKNGSYHTNNKDLKSIIHKLVPYSIKSKITLRSKKKLLKLVPNFIITKGKKIDSKIDENIKNDLLFDYNKVLSDKRFIKSKY